MEIDLSSLHHQQCHYSIMAFFSRKVQRPGRVYIRLHIDKKLYCVETPMLGSSFESCPLVVGPSRGVDIGPSAD